MDDLEDIQQLQRLNDQFIAACRAGSWEDLQPVLSEDFAYVDGVTGERWDMSRYIDDLRANPGPELGIDQVVVHSSGDTGTVSARTASSSGRFNRYLDVYAREAGEWKCVQATVWPIST